MSVTAKAFVDQVSESDRQEISEILSDEPGVRAFEFRDESVVATIDPGDVERKQVLKKVLGEFGYEVHDCEHS